MTSLVVGSRKSPLALAQTQRVIEALAGHGYTCQLKTFSTLGDERLDKPISALGDKGLFTQALDAALLAHEIDFAVHSHKDLPTQLPEGLCALPVLAREAVEDVVVLRAGITREIVKTVGTSSLRRAAQLESLFPQWHVQPVRGNVQTRLNKLEDPVSGLDALVMANAGLQRLGLGNLVGDKTGLILCPKTQAVPAAAQGVLAATYRGNDGAVKQALETLCLPEVQLTTMAERSALAAMQGGCQIAFGAYSWLETPELLWLTLMYHDARGARHHVRQSIALTAENLANLLAAKDLGQNLGQSLLKGLL